MFTAQLILFLTGLMAIGPYSALAESKQFSVSTQSFYRPQEREWRRSMIGMNFLGLEKALRKQTSTPERLRDQLVDTLVLAILEDRQLERQLLPGEMGDTLVGRHLRFQIKSASLEPAYASSQRVFVSGTYHILDKAQGSSGPLPFLFWIHTPGPHSAFLAPLVFGSFTGAAIRKELQQWSEEQVEDCPALLM